MSRIYEKFKNWFNWRLFELKTGYKTENIGVVTDEAVINLKDYGVYIDVLFDQSGNPVSLSWSDDATMFSVPIRKHYLATPPTNLIRRNHYDYKHQSS